MSSGPTATVNRADVPVFCSGNTALITGAASGIGLAVAKLCRKHGMRLALVDNSPNDLQKAKDYFENNGGLEGVETYNVDVSKIDEWKELKESVDERFGPDLDFLMLNAGIGLKGSWHDIEYFQKVCHKTYSIHSILDSSRAH